MQRAHIPPGMTLESLRNLAVVIEEGSLNRAALRLRLSQPALTRQVQALEHELGAPLLERSVRGVAPTGVGQHLVDGLREPLAQLDAVVGEVRRMARGERAELRVGYLLSTARDLLTPALAALRTAHPRVRAKLLEQSPGEQIAALRAGTIDLAVVGQEGAVLGRDFFTRKLASLGVAVVLPLTHPLAAKPNLDLKDLKRDVFVSCPEDHMPGRDRWVAQLGRRAGFKVRFGPVADDLAHILSLVAHDEVVAVVPNTVRTIPHPGVAVVELARPAATWDLVVVWQRGKISPPLKVLLDALAGASRQL